MMARKLLIGLLVMGFASWLLGCQTAPVQLVQEVYEKAIPEHAKAAKVYERGMPTPVPSSEVPRSPNMVEEWEQTGEWWSIWIAADSSHLPASIELYNWVQAGYDATVPYHWHWSGPCYALAHHRDMEASIHVSSEEEARAAVTALHGLVNVFEQERHDRALAKQKKKARSAALLKELRGWLSNEQPTVSPLN